MTASNDAASPENPGDTGILITPTWMLTAAHEPQVSRPSSSFEVGVEAMRCWWLILFGTAVLPTSPAMAACIDVLDVRNELPYVLETPEGKTLSYFYNLEREQYVILLSLGEEDATTHGPFSLQRNCLPGRLRWESSDFVLIESGCGTFCWLVDVLSGSGRTRRVFRPLDFDEERNLLLFYAEQDTLGVENLVTQREQRIRTAEACESASSLCFAAARFDGNEVTYTWDDGRVFRAPLDDAVRGE